MQGGPVTRWLRPSAIEGAWILRQEMRRSQGISAEHAIRLLCTTYSSSGFDFQAAHEILREEIPTGEGHGAFFRAVFFEAMARERPPVLVLLTRGREAFTASLPSDAVECLRRCEALEANPHSEVLEWLDALSGLARTDIDLQKLAKGRQAERQSLQWEKDRLSGFSDAPVPVWVSLDDNAAGYDIRSFEAGTNGYVPRLIEVKSSAATLPEFFLTRNEVRVARQNRAHYLVHIWAAQAAAPLEIPWPELDPHIPQDTARAKWTEVLIKWPVW